MRNATFSFLCLLAVSASAEEPLHILIDQHLWDAQSPAVLSSDDEFLRRVSLDLIGIPPSAADVRSFLSNEQPDKRLQIVQKLIESPHFDRHLTTSLDLMLMERHRNQHVPQNDWYSWLFTQVQSRRPWNEIVHDILVADGADGPQRPAARFYLDRQSEPHRITRDVGRIFFGRDLQCAQCHDHPNINDYLQADYHGLHAFLAPSYPVVVKVTQKEGDKSKTVEQTVHAERAGTDLTFESVFFKGTKRRTGPRLPDEVSVAVEFLYPGDEYRTAPAEGVLSVPQISRRAQLAERMTSGKNRMFNENIANRLWAHMLGRGLVHPVDLHHFENPPVSPALMTLLGERIAVMQFDLRVFLKEIALSKTYQRSFDVPANLLETASASVDALALVEQQMLSLEQSAAAADDVFDRTTDAWDAAQEAFVPLAAELDTARKGYDEARKNQATADVALQKNRTELQAKQNVLVVLQQALTTGEAAANAVSDDPDLRVAVDVFRRRMVDVEKAIPPLQKHGNEAQAAADAASEVFEKKKNEVDAVRDRLPLVQTRLAESETDLLDKRRVMQHQKTTFAALQRRREILSALAELPLVQKSIEENESASEQHRDDVTTIEGRIKAQQLLIAERATTVTRMSQPMEEARQTVEAAQAILTRKTTLVQALLTAIQATAAASASLPDDPVLVEVGSKLSERLVPLQKAQQAAAKEVRRAEAAAADRRQQHDNAAAELQRAVARMTQHEETLLKAESAVTAAVHRVKQAKEDMQSRSAKIVEDWSAEFSVASLKPLTPEQLGWAVLKVTGVYDRYYAMESEKLEKAAPLSDEQLQDATAVDRRQREIEEKTWDVLNSNVGDFVRLYASAAGAPQGDFFATADQAMFVSNAAPINGWIVPSNNNPSQRVINAQTPEDAAEELYLSILSRRPTSAEQAEVSQLLAARPAERTAVVQQLVWGLLTSIEFRFNH